MNSSPLSLTNPSIVPHSSNLGLTDSMSSGLHPANMENSDNEMSECDPVLTLRKCSARDDSGGKFWIESIRRGCPSALSWVPSWVSQLAV